MVTVTITGKIIEASPSPNKLPFARVSQPIHPSVIGKIIMTRRRGG